MLRVLFLAAPLICGVLLAGHTAEGAPRRARQVGAGLLFPGTVGGFGVSGGHQVTHVKTKKSEKVYSSSSAVSPGGYTATVHASPFLSSGGYGSHSGHLRSFLDSSSQFGAGMLHSSLGAASNLLGGGVHHASFSTGGLHDSGLLGGLAGFRYPLGHHASFGSGGFHGGYLGGLESFHAPMTATGHLLLGGGGFGDLGHQMSSFSTGSLHGGAYGGLLQGPQTGGLSSVTHHLSISSGNLHQAAAEHQHLTDAAQAHTQLASEALAAADAAHNAQLQAALYHKQLLQKAMSHQTYAQKAQQAANTAHQRLLHESATHAALTSLYHSGHSLNGAYNGGLQSGYFGGGLQYPSYAAAAPSFHTTYVQPSYPWQQGGHGLSVAHGGGFGYGSGVGTVAVQYPETHMQSVIRNLKHCTSVHYTDSIPSGQDLYGGPFGLNPGLALGGAYGGFGYGGLNQGHVAFGSGVLPSQVGVPLAPAVLPHDHLTYGSGLLHHGLGYEGGLLAHHHLLHGSGGLYDMGGIAQSGFGYGGAALHHGGFGYGGALHHAGIGYGGALSHGGLTYGGSLSHGSFGYGNGLLSHNGFSYGSGVLGSHPPSHGSPLGSSVSSYHYRSGGGFPMAGGFQHSFRR